MSARVLSVRTYVIVLVLLLALTALTVGVSFVPLAGHWHIAIGLAIAYAGGRSVSGLVYGVRASDPLVLASATLVVALISSVATALPARRASRVDPILALRGE